MRLLALAGFPLLGALLATPAQATPAWRTVFDDPHSMTVQVKSNSITYREEGLAVFATGEVRVKQAPGNTYMQQTAQTGEIWMRVEADCSGTLRYRVVEVARVHHGQRDLQPVDDPGWRPYNLSTPEESFGYALCEGGDGEGAG